MYASKPGMAVDRCDSSVDNDHTSGALWRDRVQHVPPVKVVHNVAPVHDLAEQIPEIRPGNLVTHTHTRVRMDISVFKNARRGSCHCTHLAKDSAARFKGTARDDLSAKHCHRPQYVQHPANEYKTKTRKSFGNPLEADKSCQPPSNQAYPKQPWKTKSTILLGTQSG